MSRLGSPAAIVLGVGGLYVGQSVISGITFSALPSVLRDQGMSLDRIGLTYLAVLPWVLKFLWAPAIERYRLPTIGSSRSRRIVLVGGMVSAVCLVSAGLIGPERLLPLMAALMILAFAASTVDIACDGHAVESLSERHHGWGNAAQVGGAYIGAAIGSGLFLVLVDRLDWTQATLIMAALVVLLGLPFVLSPVSTPDVPRTHRPSLRDALRRVEMHKGLALAAVYTLTQKWGLSMIGPFLVDKGLDLSCLGVVNGVGGLGVGFACALLGGVLVRAWSARPILVIALVLQAGALAGLAIAARSDEVPKALLLTLALASSSAVMALGYVALYAHFMALSDPRQAGIDFTLLQCTDAGASMVGGIGAGWIAQSFGYVAFFGIAGFLAVMAVPAGIVLSGRSSKPRPSQDRFPFRQQAS
ncbi:MFS transporter [Microvirga sp. TS319]|uniref:MFS transporter n=1 Tax=Microvirga sp. TS319 TaxID=3241165 RepID=UPI00351AAFCD